MMEHGEDDGDKEKRRRGGGGRLRGFGALWGRRLDMDGIKSGVGTNSNGGKEAVGRGEHTRAVCVKRRVHAHN